jgi:hypothetical protein
MDLSISSRAFRDRGGMAIGTAYSGNAEGLGKASTGQPHDHPRLRSELTRGDPLVVFMLPF